MTFGKRTERHQTRKAEGRENEGEPEKSNDDRPKASGDQDTFAESLESESEENPKRKGHGSRSASDYSDARIFKCQHERLKTGDNRPASYSGLVYDLKEPTTLMQFMGQQLIQFFRTISIIRSSACAICPARDKLKLRIV